MNRGVTLVTVIIAGLFIGRLDSQTRPAPLDKYLQPASITQMDWKLHLLDERLREALRSARITYRTNARYTFNKEISLSFSIPTNEFKNLTDDEKRTRLMRVVNLASTLLTNTFPEFVLNRDLYVAFIPDGSAETLFAEYKKGELRFPPSM